MRHPKAPPRAALTILFALIVFLVLVVTMVIVGGVMLVLIQTGVLKQHAASPNLVLILVTFALVSVMVGTVVAAIIGRLPLKPMNRLINGLNRLAAGDYDVRIRMGGHPVGREISNSFNILASELRNTEMLRSDFINNFSHEFKTPIVSIRGFAKLLKKDNIPEARRQEYLNIIVDESSRLADMATNVLNLTKVENQSILTDVTRFNLSEQIRGCVLLLEKKWTGKELEIAADFDEYDISANEELLKQVWINLLDNAIKFSEEGGEIGILITQAAETLSVAVKNGGPQISEEDQRSIFRKFWQGDTSHTSEGTGIGLSIASQIVKLHEGTLSVASSPVETVFSVELPVG